LDEQTPDEEKTVHSGDTPDDAEVFTLPLISDDEEEADEDEDDSLVV